MSRKRYGLNGVVVYWPDDAHLENEIESGSLPSHNTPQFATVPRSRIVVATQGGISKWCFRIGRIAPAKRIAAADGQRRAGWRFYPLGKIRRVRSTDNFARVSGSPWVGAIRYFDEGSGKMIRVQAAKRRVTQMPPPVGNAFSPFFHPVLTDNRGEHLSAPEAALVKDYVDWTGNYPAFATKHRSAAGEIDLMLSRPHTIIEAKAHVHRDAIRMAIGQLFDYRRGFRRKPDLAILLPTKPDADTLHLLESVRVSAIWKDGRHRFADSNHGRLTNRLRR